MDPLVAVSLLQSFLYLLYGPYPVKRPKRGDVVIPLSLARKAMYYDILGKVLQKIADELCVFVLGQNSYAAVFVELFELASLKDVQEVDFHAVNFQLTQASRGLDDLFPCFAGKADYHMDAYRDR